MRRIACIALGALASAAVMCSSARAADFPRAGLVSQDAVLRGAPRDSATAQAQLWRGEALELRGERADHWQVWDYRRERGGWMGGNFEVEAEFQVDDSPLPDQRLADSQSQERVRAALGRLSADQLQVIELSYYEEKAHGDIANTLGIPLGTVKSRLRLAMGRLRELLREPS